jgi:indole-3-glycerol phosphate synthase
MSEVDILTRILTDKRREVTHTKQQTPQEALVRRIADLPPARDFVAALRDKAAADEPAVIAEFKRASPSAGNLAATLEPGPVAKAYQAAGAACLSVLTDGPYFRGSLVDLSAARAACTLPILRKDFIIDAYQLYEARAAGADAVLFIIGVLDIQTFRHLEGIATSLGLAVLVEVHTAEQLAEALLLETPLIGVNNRDLTRFTTDLSISERLLPSLPPERFGVAESGIESPADLRRLRRAGVRSFLVGSALMRSGDPAGALRLLLSEEPAAS